MLDFIELIARRLGRKPRMVPSLSRRPELPRRRRIKYVLASSIWMLVVSHAGAQPKDSLPNPLRLEDVLAYGRTHRQEIAAARARARAAAERPAMVSALEDPMLMPSVDHLPFMLHGVDASLMVEQRFPLSGILGARERGAQAAAHRFRADAERVSQDVQLEAATAFFMLRERREMARVVGEQLTLAREFVAAASSRYGSGSGGQAEVLRAEIEVARFEGALRALQAEVAAAEAMLNAGLGRAADAWVPPLQAPAVTSEPQTWSEVRAITLRRRPELEMGRAEIGRSQAQLSEMHSMYGPMGLVRTGPAYTMTDSWGWMFTFGLSIPLQRGRLDAGVREAQAMAQMARAELAAMTTMAEGEAAAARSQLIAARQRLSALRDDILPRAKQAMEPTIAAYAVGTLPLVSVIETAQALWSVESELVTAEFEVGVAWARFQRAQGMFSGGAKR